MPESDVEAWLDEDAADADLTSRSVIPEGAKAQGSVEANQDLVAAGMGPATQVFEALGAEVEAVVADGERVESGDVLLRVRGPARGLLAAERTALNLLAHLSGIATRTAAVVEAVEAAPGRCQVLATRKTTPGLRRLEHGAVEAGGASPHRADLSEAVLVKENHLSFVTVEEAVEAAYANAPDAFVMVEAETMDEARQVARAGADGVLLDNFEPDALEDTVELLKRIEPSLVVEASGGITLQDVAAYAEHVDRVSLGSLTHSAPAADVSLRIEPGA